MKTKIERNRLPVLVRPAQLGRHLVPREFLQQHGLPLLNSCSVNHILVQHISKERPCKVYERLGRIVHWDQYNIIKLLLQLVQISKQYSRKEFQILVYH